MCSYTFVSPLKVTFPQAVTYHLCKGLLTNILFIDLIIHFSLSDVHLPQMSICPYSLNVGTSFISLQVSPPYVVWADDLWGKLNLCIIYYWRNGCKYLKWLCTLKLLWHCLINNWGAKIFIPFAMRAFYLGSSLLINQYHIETWTFEMYFLDRYFLYFGSNHHQTPSISHPKSKNLNVSGLVLHLFLPNPLKPGENEDVIGAVPTDNVPSSSEWSASLLPTKVPVILEVGWYKWNIVIIWIIWQMLSCIRSLSRLSEAYMPQ